MAGLFNNHIVFFFLLIRIIHSFPDEDSDVDEVTDYLNSNTNAPDGIGSGSSNDVADTKSSPDANVNKSTKSNASPASTQRNTPQLPSQNNHQSHNHHINNNMVPIISVTPHSPGAKFNNILGKKKTMI